MSSILQMTEVLGAVQLLHNNNRGQLTIASACAILWLRPYLRCDVAAGPGVPDPRERTLQPPHCTGRAEPAFWQPRKPAFLQESNIPRLSNKQLILWTECDSKRSAGRDDRRWAWNQAFQQARVMNSSLVLAAQNCQSKRRCLLAAGTIFTHDPGRQDCRCCLLELQTGLPDCVGWTPI